MARPPWDRNPHPMVLWARTATTLPCCYRGQFKRFSLQGQVLVILRHFRVNLHQGRRFFFNVFSMSFKRSKALHGWKVGVQSNINSRRNQLDCRCWRRASLRFSPVTRSKDNLLLSASGVTGALGALFHRRSHQANPKCKKSRGLSRAMMNPSDAANNWRFNLVA